ncbi:hypothetical protein OZY48_03245 [Aliarcobacter cryaerophilus]|uniref:hypothetical protein n=1 Tax=Aliarcobacter cryaerophilus TaxID=28198 RepID=UPI003BAEA941
MNSYIEVNDADYKYILAKGGRVEQFSGIFNNNDSVESALKPIINDLKIAQGLLIKFITSSKYEQFYNIAKIMDRINNLTHKDALMIIDIGNEDLETEIFKFEIIISGLPEN